VGCADTVSVLFFFRSSATVSGFRVRPCCPVRAFGVELVFIFHVLTREPFHVLYPFREKTLSG